MKQPAFKWWGGGGDMLDQIICACGWESHTYFNGREFAYIQWKRHVEEDHPKKDKGLTDIGKEGESG